MSEPDRQKTCPTADRSDGSNLHDKPAFPNVIDEKSELRDLTTEGAFRVNCRVPTYIYETTDPKKPIRNFEVKQSVHDEPLRRDPKTGEAVRRIISAGYGVLIRGKSIGPSVGSVGSH